MGPLIGNCPGGCMEAGPIGTHGSLREKGRLASLRADWPHSVCPMQGSGSMWCTARHSACTFGGLSLWRPSSTDWGQTSAAPLGRVQPAQQPVIPWGITPCVVGVRGNVCYATTLFATPSTTPQWLPHWAHPERGCFTSRVMTANLQCHGSYWTKVLDTA